MNTTAVKGTEMQTKKLAKSCANYSGNGGPCRRCMTDYTIHFHNFTKTTDGWIKNDWAKFNGWTA